jgi:hypothetical protein
MERMGHDNMRAALIYQHSTRDAGGRIADALQAQMKRGESSANRTTTRRKEPSNMHCTPIPATPPQPCCSRH